MSQLPSPKVTRLSSSPVLERAPGRDGVGGQCNWPVERSGVEKLWRSSVRRCARNMLGRSNAAKGCVGRQHVARGAARAVSASCMGGRVQRWAVSAASMWRGARPGGRVRIMLGGSRTAEAVCGQHAARSAARWGRVRIMLWGSRTARAVGGQHAPRNATGSGILPTGRGPRLLGG